MMDTSSSQMEMNEKAKLLVQELNEVNPLNLMRITTASEDLHSSFLSVWFRHSHQAARYMLLPYLYDRRIEFTK